MNKVELIAATKTQWAKTEASVGVAAKGNFDAKPADGAWSASECYRHIIDVIHKAPEAIEQLKHGQPMTALTPGDEKGLEDFKSLTARTIPVEMNTAHGIVWMALQKLTDADLEKSVEMGGHTFTLGGFLEIILIGHEQGHAEQAKAAAGVA